MKRITIFLFLFTINLIYAEDAYSLNKLGLKYYESGKYVDAIEYFEKAIKFDSKYIWPYYNLSCMLSLVLQGMESENKKLTKEDVSKLLKIYPDSEYYPAFTSGYLLVKAFEYLKIAVNKDCEIKTMALSDPDLEYLRKYYGFYKIYNYNMNTIYTINQVLLAVKYFGCPGDGMIDPMAILDFAPMNTVSIVTYGEGNQKIKTDGKYSIDDTSGKCRIIIIFNDGRKANAEIDPNGIIHLNSEDLELKHYELFIPNYTRSIGA